MPKDTVEIERERLEDLYIDANYAAKKFSKDYSWPGPTRRVKNIRDELKTILEDE